MLLKGLKKKRKEFLDRAIVATSNDFLRQYEFERQLEYSRFIAKRDQEKEQRRQAKEDQERQKRLERIAKEEQSYKNKNRSNRLRLRLRRWKGLRPK